MIGNDKTLTLTHCRFEAKSVYGLDDVISIDFDEFFYCHQASPLSISSQHQYIHSLFHYMKSIGQDQLSASQRILMNMTSSVTNCLNDKIANLKSIFECFGPFYIRVSGRLLKSIYLGLKCPLTGFHSSCSWEMREGMSHDCLCSSMNINDHCQFVHIVTRQSDYDKCKGCTVDYKNNVQLLSSLPKNELWQLSTMM